MSGKVNLYFSDGCGRCSLYRTLQCKVHTWSKELTRLRKILLGCGLSEELKWRVPCYTYQNCNIVLMSAFKEYCALTFFKGALLKDPHGILTLPGENTQAARLIRFANVQDIVKLEPVVTSYIDEAIAVEQAGLKVTFKNITEHSIPEEFQLKLAENAALKSAFRALTPGRQRGYLLYFSAAKQSKTRETRIQKCVPQILAGKGLHD